MGRKKYTGDSEHIHISRSEPNWVRFRMQWLQSLIFLGSQSEGLLFLCPAVQDAPIYDAAWRGGGMSVCAARCPRAQLHYEPDRGQAAARGLALPKKKKEDSLYPSISCSLLVFLGHNDCKQLGFSAHCRDHLTRWPAPHAAWVMAMRHRAAASPPVPTTTPTSLLMGPVLVASRSEVGWLTLFKSSPIEQVLRAEMVQKVKSALPHWG